MHKEPLDDRIGILQNNDFVGFLRKQGAEKLIENAKASNIEIEEFGDHLNVVLNKLTGRARMRGTLQRP